MKYQKHQPKTFKDFLANFKRVHKEPRPNQLTVLSVMPTEDRLMVQAPTGTGKTALGYSYLRTHCSEEEEQNGMYICPNKTLVDGVVSQYPEIMPMYGRNEYPCLYYNSEFAADEIPCSLLRDCPHRVNLETGETMELGVKPCPYLQAKYKSRKSNLVACTTQYYFFEALSREELPHAIVVDEVHKWANSIRGMMQYHITDRTLEEFWVLLTSIGCYSEAKHVRDFCDSMIDIIRQYKGGGRTSLLQDEDLKAMLRILLRVKRSNIDDKIRSAIKQNKINPKTDRELLKALDDFTGSLYKYVKSLEFSLGTADRKPLSYVFGFWDKEAVPGQKAQYILSIRSYAIAGLTAKRLLPEKFLSMSATIGRDPEILVKETGITGTFIDLESDFPIENTKVYIPMDVPDLSVKGMRRNDKNRTIRQMLRGVHYGAKKGIRSLIIVVSDEERRKCIEFAAEEGVIPITYDSDIKPREAVRLFREGFGDVLIGTEAQYGEGIDLPNGTASFIFYLRPGYPSPEDPQAQFEERRLGGARWALWTWRVITKMLQARGRTIRSSTDSGCIFLMSQQFKRFTFSGLPKWLQPAYVSSKTFEECLKDGIKLMKNIHTFAK